MAPTDTSLEHRYASDTSCQANKSLCKKSIDVYQYLRDVCSSKLLTAPIVLGGPGKVVQIDESLFVHTQKVQLVDTNFMFS